jgi:O-acetylserine/cysteine efflux transporter
VSRPLTLSSTPPGDAARADPAQPSPNMTSRDLAMLIGANVLWGVNLIVSKVGLAQFPSMLFTLLRFSILAVCLVPWLRVRRGQMNTLLVASLFIGALQFALYFWGLRMATNVASVAIANQLSVPFSTLLSIALLGEVVHWRRWTGITLSFLGVLVLGFDPDVATQWQSLAFVISGAFIGCVGLIAIKKLQGFSPLELQAWIAWISLPLLLVLTLEFDRPDMNILAHISLTGWGALLYTAIGSSLIAYTIYFYLIARYPITSVAPVTTLSPVFSVVLCVLFLNEALSARLIIGGACTLIGVFIITMREKRIVDTGT